LLNTLEKKGLLKSEWNTNTVKPRKIYNLRSNGQNLLNFSEEYLNLICRKMEYQINNEKTLEPSNGLTVSINCQEQQSCKQNV